MDICKLNVYSGTPHDISTKPRANLETQINIINKISKSKAKTRSTQLKTNIPSYSSLISYQLGFVYKYRLKREEETKKVEGRERERNN
jgi:hypothetical protein